MCAHHVRAAQPSSLLRLPLVMIHGLGLRQTSGQQESLCKCCRREGREEGERREVRKGVKGEERERRKKGEGRRRREEWRRGERKDRGGKEEREGGREERGKEWGEGGGRKEGSEGLRVEGVQLQQVSDVAMSNKQTINCQIITLIISNYFCSLIWMATGNMIFTHVTVVTRREGKPFDC